MGLSSLILTDLLLSVCDKEGLKPSLTKMVICTVGTLRGQGHISYKICFMNDTATNLCSFIVTNLKKSKFEEKNYHPKLWPKEYFLYKLQDLQDLQATFVACLVQLLQCEPTLNSCLVHLQLCEPTLKWFLIFMRLCVPSLICTKLFSRGIHWPNFITVFFFTKKKKVSSFFSKYHNSDQ